MQVIVKPKVFFFRASFFRWRQNLLLYHMYHFWCRWWEQSRPEPYLFLSTSILQCRMTSWDWSLQRQYWKLFNWSFHGWRWSGRRCVSRILIVESTRRNIWIKMRKKNVYEVEMCDDQLRFFLFLVLLSRRPKSWIFSSSPIFDKSQISLFSWALVLDLHRLHGCREERCPCSGSNVVAKKNVWSGRRISRRAIHNYFLFLLY